MKWRRQDGQLAQTMGLDTKTHKLFLDTAAFHRCPRHGGASASPKRGDPGTFHVLVTAVSSI